MPLVPGLWESVEEDDGTVGAAGRYMMNTQARLQLGHTVRSHCHMGRRQPVFCCGRFRPGRPPVCPDAPETGTRLSLFILSK